MIYTLTLNPALDYTVNVESLKHGSIIRSTDTSLSFGGKGINVSCILKELGTDSVALGFAAGFTGEALVNSLKANGIKQDFVFLKSGNTRINVKIRDLKETDINALGPEATPAEITELYEKLALLKIGDVLVMAGSIPNGMPKAIYANIMQMLSNKGILFVADTSGEALTQCLKHKPFLIKPNNDELGDIFGTKISTPKKALLYAQKLQAEGVQNVLVSLGSKGSVLRAADGNEYFCKAPSLTAKSTVGAGDSMVAGFLAGYLDTNDYAYALKLGTACGAATAASIGLATKELIDKYNIL